MYFLLNRYIYFVCYCQINTITDMFHFRLQFTEVLSLKCIFHSELHYCSWQVCIDKLKHTGFNPVFVVTKQCKILFYTRYDRGYLKNNDCVCLSSLLVIYRVCHLLRVFAMMIRRWTSFSANRLKRCIFSQFKIILMCN